VADFKEQRICIKFNHDPEKPPSEIHELLQKAFFDDSVSRTETFECYSQVKIGQNLVEDLEISGQPL
jgi:hypothetical protein